MVAHIVTYIKDKDVRQSGSYKGERLFKLAVTVQLVASTRVQDIDVASRPWMTRTS